MLRLGCIALVLVFLIVFARFLRDPGKTAMDQLHQACWSYCYVNQTISKRNFKADESEDANSK